MKKSYLSFLSTFIVCGFVAKGLHAEGELPDLSRGASLYSANCGRCHNPRGPGEFSDREWPLIITHMRVIAGLPGEHARTIEAFMRASNNPPPRSVETVKAMLSLTGPELLHRNGCRGCHKIGGAGGTIGPDLREVFERRSEDWVRVQIQTPREHNPKTVMPQLGLTDAEVSAIIQALQQQAQ